MRFVKRIFCAFLAALCVFFTGCNSIIYNGNLSFKAYEPETVPVIYDEIEEKMEDIEKQDFEEKYRIQGTNAFYILPNHENKPDEILDFKVLDYNSKEEFVYAYLTPYYGSTEDASGLGGAAASGQAPKERAMTDTKDTNYHVTVLMSYNPQTRNYKVFYSSLSEKKEEETRTESVEGVGELHASVSDSFANANRLAKREEYFIFDNLNAYIYDRDGKQIRRSDYSSIVAGEISRLVEQAKSKNVSAKHVEATIMDVVMDGLYLVYIPVVVELSENETGEDLDDDYDEDDMGEELDETTYNTIIACYDLDIGGEDCTVPFLSRNEAWERQEEVWEKVQVTDKTKKLLDGEIFRDADSMKEYQRMYSMDSIKKGSYGNARDAFSVFRTKDTSSVNMELAVVPDVFQFSLIPLDSSNKSLGTQNFGMHGIIEKFQGSWYARLSSWARFALSIGYFFDGDSYYRTWFWSKISPQEREQMISFVKGSVVLMGQGDPEIIQKARTSSKTASYLIPWLSPGDWNDSSKNNSLYFPQADKVEAMFAYRTSVYQSGGQEKKISRYNSIEFADRYSNKNKYPRISYEVTEWSPALTRTLQYYDTETIIQTTTDEEGNEVTEEVTEKVVRSVTEKSGQYPQEYRIIFPKNTEIFWVEEVDTAELVSASGDMGAIYYTETGDAEYGEESFSEIRYNNGDADVLRDNNVPGKAMDVGVLYHVDASGNETEVVAFVTDTGIKYYKRNGQKFKNENALYVSLQDMTQAKSGYGVLRQGQVTRTDESTDPKLDVTDTEQEIISEKLDSGAVLDAFGAENFSLLNSDAVLVNSLTNGILMTNLGSGLTISLVPGAYYAAFPYMDASAGSRRFMVVGYDTENFTYQPADVAWAKCYAMDLDAQNAVMEDEALKAYLDSLVSAYLTRRYRTVWSEETKAYQIADNTQEEKKADQLVEDLFYKEESSTKNQLKKLVASLGFSSVSSGVETYALDIRKKLLAQNAALAEFYRLAGMGVVSRPDNAKWLEEEGLLLTANYVDTLENILVDMKLSDRAISYMPLEKRAEYREYQRQSQEASKLNSRDVNWEMKINDDSDSYASEVADSLSALSHMSFYRKVLDDTRQEYEGSMTEEQREKTLSWEDYLEDLLTRISPDCAINQQRKGIEELCQLVGFTKQTVNLDALAEDVSSLKRVVELEEVILRHKFQTTAFQNSPYRKEFEEFEEKTFATVDEKEAAFRGAKFYKLIQDMIDENQKVLENTTWEDKLTAILGKCGAGIVLGRTGEN